MLPNRMDSVDVVVELHANIQMDDLLVDLCKLFQHHAVDVDSAHHHVVDEDNVQHYLYTMRVPPDEYKFR